MLLSMITSFLLARLLHGKVYVLIMTVLLILISFFSAGVPEYVFVKRGFFQHGMWVPDDEGLLIKNPLPLSFPFYSSRFDTWWGDGTYRICFISLTLQDFPVYETQFRFMQMSWPSYFAFYALFISINILGAIIGYQLGRRTILAKLSSRQEKKPC